jgi:hypothetical protein
MAIQNYKVFKGQGYLKLELDCKNLNILTGSIITQTINYEKPDRTTGSWEATRSGTVISYQMANEDIDQDGTWAFQAVLIIDDLVAPCEIIRINFSLPILETIIVEP